ncbi:hypothetical protein BDP27DRAFT_1325030 [Rhodocollybia butyracea]|uniref:Cellobiose dehydrogenase-like cytochrome domain-containing protein n=1 Tax=Rhodocollybia butyracea TaxID=206335 RepID=A0A9P5PUK8_9AGAR|nr:hypothetical protein BDP27DRAFT_1325030 [Rhodocollybia butyracea]
MGFFLMFSIASVLCFSKCISARTTCEGSLCFETVQILAQNMSFGLALPSPEATNAGLREFIANFTFPLPYGFSQFSLNEDGSFILTEFGVFRSDVLQQISVNGSFLDAEIVIPDRTNHTLIPIGKNATISTLSSVTNSSITMIIRCQECGALDNDAVQLFDTSRRVFNLSLGFSPSLPQYIDSTRTFAILPNNATTLSNIEFDLAAARFDNYTAMVAIGGFQRENS